MAKRIKPQAIRNQIANDLLALFRVLQDDSSGVVVNPEALSSAANQAGRESKDTSWSYEIADLQLRADIPQNVLPHKCGDWLNIHIDLNLCGICDQSLDDFLTELILQIRIETNTKQNICSWHFDRHIGDVKADQIGEAHPLYHFQHGGHAMKHLADSLGKTLLLPAPRLAFPPMDAVLALDFVLSNFSGACWQGLRNEATYIRLLKDSQMRYWRPYVNRLASWWNQGPKDDAAITALWPHLV